MKSAIGVSVSDVERRAHPRQCNTSSVFVGDGVVVRRCRLMDVSEGGARIATGDARMLARDVTLIDPRTGLSHRAQLVWQSGFEAGLRFIGQGVRYRVMTAPGDLRPFPSRWAS